jgi:endonuclease/exonuclease/phosphatase family metal-dependent hydrolase
VIAHFEVLEERAVYVGAVRLRVLTWNLMHGRSVPGSGRDLVDEFAAALADWEWDVALLQEVPPWWPRQLSARLNCEYAIALTSRNGLLAMRRFIAVRRPDLIKSGGGGANAILARADRIAQRRSVRLCRLPERRVAHGIQLGYGLWIVNLHATVHHPDRARRDLAVAAQHARDWARPLPLVLGGDFNLRDPDVPGMKRVASSDVDHVLIGPELRVLEPARTLDRGILSDHVPLSVSLELGER